MIMNFITILGLAREEISKLVFVPLVLLIYGGIFALILIGLIRFIKFLSSVPKEQKLLRMELGKLAEEVLRYAKI